MRVAADSFMKRFPLGCNLARKSAPGVPVGRVIRHLPELCVIDFGDYDRAFSVEGVQAMYVPTYEQEALQLGIN